MYEPPADHQPLLLWLPRPLKRQVSQRARRLEMLDSEMVVDVLRRAFEPPSSPRRLHVLPNSKTPATAAKQTTGAQGTNGTFGDES